MAEHRSAATTFPTGPGEPRASRTSARPRPWRRHAAPATLLLAASLAACGGNGDGGGGTTSDGGTTQEFTDASIAAGGDPKRLAFAWAFDGSADAFRLEVNPDGASGFTAVDRDGDGDVDADDQLDGSATAAELALAVHRADFVGALYQVVALDASGDALDRSAELPLMDVASEDLIGYFKASNTEAGDLFGNRAAISADGRTLAIVAFGEDSAATGIGGDQGDNSADDAGAVYVFVREDGGAWTQQAYIKASNTDSQDAFGIGVTLSADGDTLAVGAQGEDSAATGIDGDEGDNSAADAGAVYVYARDDTGGWSQQAYVKASNTDAADFFGGAVALADGGDTLAVGAVGEESAATGVDGTQGDNSAFQAGAVYVFARDTAGDWSQQAYIKASNTETGDIFGGAVALAGDGATLAVGARFEDSAATGVDGDQGDNSAGQAGAVYVFARDTAGDWSQQAYLKASNTDGDDRFGGSVALAGDGATLAVGAVGEESDATGVDGDQGDNSAQSAGAAYVYTRDGSGNWSQQAYVKASNTDEFDVFGAGVALSADGAMLAVSASGEGSAATGVGGDPSDDSAAAAGAAYVFARDTASGWSQIGYIKASNTEESDFFGVDVTLDGAGNTLMVGTCCEESAATGIGGDQGDNSADDAGAVYLY